jgi:la-related protein 1
MAGTSPALPAFSYAQAAKGLAPATQSQPDSSVNTSETPSTVRKSSIPDQEKLESPPAPASAGKIDEVSYDIVAKAVPDDADTTSTAKVNPDKSFSSATKQTSASHPDSKQASETTSPSLVPSVATLPREDESSSTPNDSSESWDKQSEASALAEKMTQTDGGKEKAGDEDWINVSAPKVEKELKAAPIPAVNFWQQRMEATAAKAKADVALRSSTGAAAPVKPKPQVQPGRHMESQTQDDESKRKSSGRFIDKGDGIAKKKQLDDTKARDDSKCSFLRSCEGCLLSQMIGKRSARPGKASELDKDTTPTAGAPPPASDASLWPTPDTATYDEKKKSQSQDKGDSKSPGMKPNQKWVPVPYVPTAKFNTPLPPTMARRGGRSIRGSRDGGSRGGHIPQGSMNEKTDKMRLMGPPPGPKQTPEQQRGRDQEAMNSNRAASAPTQGRRSASVGPALGDQRRSTQMEPPDHNSFQTNKQTTSEAQDANFGALPAGDEEVVTPVKLRPDSRSISRQSSLSYRAGTIDNARYVSGESHAHPRGFAGTERRNTYAETDRTMETPSGRRERRGSNKDMAKTRDADFKSDTLRERDFTGERSEQRSGRGRGSYRGRGAHSNYSAGHSHQTYAASSPLPQQPFSGGKPHTLGDRHRQPSAPYTGMPAQSNQRNVARSQSIATHGIYPGAPNNFGPTLSPIQTDMQGMFGGYATMYPGVMSAIPFNSSLEPMALISLVSAQVEYYFSIENLCKDMYLRTHMDSQGWVPLSVIAGFNRIKSLTEDMSLIRHVCLMSRNIEFRPGDDGTDRLRKLDKWDQWILDMDQRQPHARNEGPPPLQRSQSPSQFNSMFPSMSQMTSPTWAPGSFYNGYTEPPTFNPAPSASEHQNPTTPAPGNLPELPASEDFSLMNGQAELGSGQQADVLGFPKAEALVQTMLPNRSSPVNISVSAMNGHAPASPQEIGVENVFSNERMNELHVCVQHPTNQYPPSLMSPGARTFSHGSIGCQSPGSAHLANLANPMPSLRGGASSPER